MRSPSYQDAIRWMAEHDDTEWITDEEPLPSVTACMVSDLFNVPVETVIGDLRQAEGIELVRVFERKRKRREPTH